MKPKLTARRSLVLQSIERTIREIEDPVAVWGITPQVAKLLNAQRERGGRLADVLRSEAQVRLAELRRLL